ncbi:MAG: glucokinase, partial [Thermodesulfobacteriota bacterium]|nr:glucokinase [Thermodesulfobacteriota bacterium]
MKKILAADIGGTHARFGFFETDPKAGLSLSAVNWLKTKESASFAELVNALAKSDLPLDPKDADAVVIAIAGPVEAGVRSDPPNISWDIDLSNA